MKSVVASALALSFAAAVFAGCGGAHSSALPGSSTAASAHVRHLKSEQRGIKDVGGMLPSAMSVNVNLADAPLTGLTGANFNLGVLGIDAIDENGDSWQLTGSSTPDVIDVFTLQRSALSLGTGTLPPGAYPSIQLLLDPATTQLVYHGQTYPIRFTSPNHPWWDSTQTVEAVTIPLSVSGGAGDSITASLDFNVFQSASFRNGVVYLNPVVPAGYGQPAINGTVVNAAGAPVASATVIAVDNSGNLANVTVTAADGSFQLHGISAGGYTITVLNSYTTDAGETVTAVGSDASGAPSTYQVVGPNSSVSVGTLTD